MHSVQASLPAKCVGILLQRAKKKARRAGARLYAFMLFASYARMRTEYQLKFEWNNHGNWESQWGRERDINLFDRDVMCWRLLRCALPLVLPPRLQSCPLAGCSACAMICFIRCTPSQKNSYENSLLFSFLFLQLFLLFFLFARSVHSALDRRLLRNVFIFHFVISSGYLGIGVHWTSQTRAERRRTKLANTDSLGERCCCANSRMHGQPIAEISTAHEEIYMRLWVGGGTHGRCLRFWFSRIVFDGGGGGYSSASAEMNSLKGKPSPFPVKIRYGLI